LNDEIVFGVKLRPLSFWLGGNRTDSSLALTGCQQLLSFTHRT